MGTPSQEVQEALIKKDVENLVSDLKGVKDDIKDKNKTYFIVFVERKEFEPIQKIVYAAASLIILSVFGAVIASVIK